MCLLSHLSVPERPAVSVNDVTATSISISWSIPDSAVTSCEVMWQRDTSGVCPTEDQGSATITDGSTYYDIVGLEEDSTYIITLTASNDAGSQSSHPVTKTTNMAREGDFKHLSILFTSYIHNILVQLHLPLLPQYKHQFTTQPVLLSTGSQWSVSTEMER